MKKNAVSLISMTLLLFLFWVAVSGSFAWLELVAGALAAFLVAYFNRSLLIGREERPAVSFKNAAGLALYLARLMAAVIKSNFQVARLVLHPRLPIDPKLVELDVGLEREATRVLLANSITLTPGTLTVLAEGNQLIVHAMTPEAAQALRGHPMIGALKKMEDG